MDVLVEQSHRMPAFYLHSETEMRYTNTRADERQRRLSVKAIPMSIALDDSNSRSYLCNIMDTPGHLDFSDEMTAALRLVDGAVLVVDAVEGVRINTERAIHQAIQERISLVVVINKVDRLITELELAPEDAYHKLRQIIEVINNFIRTVPSTEGNIKVVDPVLGNVCFASASSRWLFTLQSFANHYVKQHGIPLDGKKFASRLWGDIYFDSHTRRFKKNQPASGVDRSFVQFVLEPLCITYRNVMKGDALAELGAQAAYRLNFRPLLRLACSSLLGSATSFTDMLVQHIPSAKDAAPQKVEHIYTGQKDSEIYQAMKTCDASAPILVNVTKLYPNPGCNMFGAFGRVYCGEIMAGQAVRVLGEGDDEEVMTMTVKEVARLWVFETRYRIPIDKAPPGSWVLIEGVDESISKNATICSSEYDYGEQLFRPLRFNTLPVVKTIIETLDPDELSKMSKGLTKISKSYPLATTKFEESGELTILGTRKLYLNTILHDLMELYPEVKWKVLVFSCSSYL